MTSQLYKTSLPKSAILLSEFRVTSCLSAKYLGQHMLTEADLINFQNVTVILSNAKKRVRRP